MTRNLIATQVHHVPTKVLAEALPYVRPFDHHYEVRQELISWVMRQRRQYDSWQEAWNDWTQAAPGRMGRIDLTVKCPECRGRLYSIRHGIPGPCLTCMGRRRVHIRAVARWLMPPEPQLEESHENPR